MSLCHLPFALLLILAGCAQNAVQTCRTETAMPSTTPADRFLMHGNGTVTDTATGLMWAQCAEGLSGSACTVGMATTLTWEAALIRARDSGLAGYTDWRLPNIKELSSIVEERCIAPAINLAVFPNTPASYFWSASPCAGSSGYPFYLLNRAWYVDFSDGDANDLPRSLHFSVRLVRSGQ